MADENVNIEAPVHEEQEEATPAEGRSAWVRRHLPDSVYLWACGETAKNEEGDLTASDRFIGWLVLLIQGLLYVLLINRAGSASSSSDTGGDDDDRNGQRGYQMALIFPAMYLLVATTLPDLRAVFSLLGNGLCAGHRAFGAGLLIVYGLIIGTAMKVLVSTNNGDTTVVLNAMLVLFVADLDTKAHAFLSTVPKIRRLFWAIFSIWISFVVAIVAIVFVGDSSRSLDILPSWFYLAVSPAAVALCSTALSNALRNSIESRREARESVDRERFGGGRYFYTVRNLWLVQGVVSWCLLSWVVLLAVAFDVAPFQFDEGAQFGRLTLTSNLGTMMFSFAVLVAGLALKLCGYLLQKQQRPIVLLGGPTFSDRAAGRQSCGRCADARGPSLLVGWGVGYWVTSLLYMLGGAWHGAGWTNVPTVVVIVGYVVLPCFFVVGILMMTDTNLLGERLGAFVKPAVDTLKDKRRVWYWIMATVLRDVFLLWVFFSVVLIYLLAFTRDA